MLRHNWAQLHDRPCASAAHVWPTVWPEGSCWVFFMYERTLARHCFVISYRLVHKARSGCKWHQTGCARHKGDNK